MPSSLGSTFGRSRFLLIFLFAFGTILLISILYLNGNEVRLLDWGSFGAIQPAQPQKEIGEENSSTRNITSSRHFRDSLNPNKKYITSFVSAGIANQIISLIHLLQLAKSTGRIPILPPFSPIHVTMRAGFLPFSDVFDVDRLGKALGMQVLEWGGGPRPLSTIQNTWTTRGIKDTSGSKLPPESRTVSYENITKQFSKPPGYFSNYFLGSPDTLGCWSLTMAQSPRGDGPRHGDVTTALSLAVSWTPIPFGHHANPRSFIVNLDYLGTLGDGKGRTDALAEVKSGYLKHVDEVRARISEAERNAVGEPFAKEIPTKCFLELPNRKEEDVLENEEAIVGIGKQFEPDEQVLCFDYLFYSSFSNPSSVDIGTESIGTALDTLGMDLHFAPKLLETTWEALKTILPGKEFTPSADPGIGSPSHNPFPPYIAVHSRRNDFDQFCRQDRVPTHDPTECFTPLSTYAKVVEEVRTELLRRHPSLSTKDIPVILFSDEPKHSNPWFTNRYHRPPGFSEKFWKEVSELKWLSLDHQTPELNTEERWGLWYPVLMDTAIMSHAAGFVGTKLSTFSLMPAKRVGRWWDGPVRMVSAVVENPRT